MDELSLRYRIALGYPADLSFADGMHRLVTLNGSPRSLGGPKTEARRDPLLDKAMVLLDDVVQVWCGSATASRAEFAGLLQLGNCAGICRVAIHVDHARHGCRAG